MVVFAPLYPLHDESFSHVMQATHVLHCERQREQHSSNVKYRLSEGSRCSSKKTSLIQDFANASFDDHTVQWVYALCSVVVGRQTYRLCISVGVSSNDPDSMKSSYDTVAGPNFGEKDLLSCSRKQSVKLIEPSGSRLSNCKVVSVEGILYLLVCNGELRVSISSGIISIPTVDILLRT